MQKISYKYPRGSPNILRALNSARGAIATAITPGSVSTPTRNKVKCGKIVLRNKFVEVI